MSYLRYVLLFFIAFSLSFSVFGQDKKTERRTKREVKRLKKFAKELVRVEDYRTALNAYLTIDSLIPEDPEIYFKIGFCYLKTNSKRKAIDYLAPIRNYRGLPDEAYYYLGRAYHLDHSFHDAIGYYEAYKRKVPEDDQIKDVDRQIAMCENGKELILQPIPVKLQNLGAVVNTPYQDYAPYISIDEQLLVFTSRRPGTTGGSFDPSIDEYFEDIYISRKQDGRWTKSRGISEKINTEEHDAAVGLSPVGNRLVIYKGETNPLNPRRAGNLYYSDQTDSGWTEPVEFDGGVNTKYWEPSASLTYDENVMYFSSDREGGYGGTDIYVVKRLPNGEWAQARNMGPVINTEYDEDGPYIHPDGDKLYFSSEGHHSMGGFDVFISTYDTLLKQWGSPLNIGYPINTADDEVFFSWSYDGKRGYFSSVRDDTNGGKDLYMITRQDIAGTTSLIQGDLKTVNGGPIYAEMVVQDKFTGRTAGIFLTDPSTGHYHMVLETGKEYKITIPYGELEIPVNLDMRDVIPETELTKNIFMDL